MRLLALYARLTAAAVAVPEPTSGTATPPATCEHGDDAASCDQCAAARSEAASKLAKERHSKARKVEELAAEPASQLDVAEALQSAAETARAIVREELTTRPAPLAAPPAQAEPKKAGGALVGVVVTALVVVAIGAGIAWAFLRRKLAGA